MGSLFSTPRVAPDPELAKQKAEQERINKEAAADQKFQREEKVRKLASNKIGQKSLQDEDVEGFTGYRRNLTKSKTMGGSYNA
jgi:hypothetical protein|tara:strand:+ start:3433 stop:3681 length:249 start_codon:yes stop_codon:yes gene_type:complete